LPAADKNQLGEEALDLELVKTAANYLRRKLGLTIFGFDVVVSTPKKKKIYSLKFIIIFLILQ